MKESVRQESRTAHLSGLDGDRLGAGVLVAFKQIGHQRSIGHAVRGMGEVMIECGQHAQGVRLLAVAKTMHAAIGVQADEQAQREAAAMLDTARAALGHDQVERLRGEGAAMPLPMMWEGLRLA